MSVGRDASVDALAQRAVEDDAEDGHPDRAADLYRESDAFRTWWDTHDVADFRSARRTFDHPRLGRLTFEYVKLAVVDAPGVALVSCLPSDEETGAKLPELGRFAPQHPPAGPQSATHR